MDLREYFTREQRRALDRVKELNDKGDSKQAAVELRTANEHRDEITNLDRQELYTAGRLSELPLDYVAARQKEASDREATQKVMDGLGLGVPPSRSFGSTVLAAGFSLKGCPAVEVPLSTAIGEKSSTLPAPTTWAVTEGGIVPGGRDTRFLHPNLVSRSVTRESAVHDFRETSASLSGNPVKRDLDAVTEKANLDIVLTSEVEELSEFATVIKSIPNAILESVDGLTDFLNSRGRYEISKAIDEHVLDQIAAANPDSGSTGTTLIEQIRLGVAAARANGASPELLAVDPGTGAELDLATSGTATPYLFPQRTTGTASPLFGMKIVEVAAEAGEIGPLLIDPAMLGVLYIGSVRVAADPYSEFVKNLTTLRLEVLCLYHVRSADGCYRIANVIS